MLPKINRLKKENDFRKVLRERAGAKEKFLILKTAPNNLGKVRVGISVSKKISKKATLRNKVKRKLAALMGQKLPQIKDGLDIFLIALPGLETQKFSETRGMCETLLKRAGALKNDGNGEKNIFKNN
jgi:ribonuclease P protein component